METTRLHWSFYLLKTNVSIAMQLSSSVYNTTTQGNNLYTHSQNIKMEHQRNIRQEMQRQLTGDIKTNTRNTGADPGLAKGWGTQNEDGEKAKINDIHNLLS